MTNKKQLTVYEKHEHIGMIIQSMQWMSEAAVEGDDETVYSTCDDIEDWLTGVSLISPVNVRKGNSQGRLCFRVPGNPSY